MGFWRAEAERERRWLAWCGNWRKPHDKHAQSADRKFPTLQGLHQCNDSHRRFGNCPAISIVASLDVSILIIWRALKGSSIPLQSSSFSSIAVGSLSSIPRYSLPTRSRTTTHIRSTATGSSALPIDILKINFAKSPGCRLSRSFRSGIQKVSGGPDDILRRRPNTSRQPRNPVNASKSFHLYLDTGLPQHRIRQMPRGYLPIYNKPRIRNRALPNVMIAFAVTDEFAAMFEQNFLHPLCITGGHQAAMARKAS